MHAWTAFQIACGANTLELFTIEFLWPGQAKNFIQEKRPASFKNMKERQIHNGATVKTFRRVCTELEQKFDHLELITKYSLIL